MKKPLSIFFITLALFAAKESMASQSDLPGAATGTQSSIGNGNYDTLARELKILQEGLAVKKEELAELHHKWVVSKGRVPTKKELKEFEKKEAQGKAKPEDNPYVNKNPLSTPGHWREAYYKKLDEIKKDEARIAQLQQELNDLKR